MAPKKIPAKPISADTAEGKTAAQSSSQSKEKPAASSEPQQVQKFCDEGPRPNEVLFPAPLYISCWIDDSHVLVGGGGGATRFGFTNCLVVLRLADKGKKNARPLWHPCGAISMGEDVVWCASDFIPHPAQQSQAQPSSRVFAVSSVQSFYLVEVNKENPSDEKKDQWTFRKGPRIPLAADELNPDKKPIALTKRTSRSPSLVIVAQDDLSIAIFDTLSVMGSERGTGKAGAGPISTLRGIWSGRIRSIATQSFSNNTVLLSTVSEDKVLRFLVLQEVKGCWVVERSLELDEAKLGLPFKMMKSTLRSVTLQPNISCGQRALAATTVFIILFDAQSGSSYLLSGAVECTKKGISFEEQTRLLLPNESITAFAILPYEEKNSVSGTAAKPEGEGKVSNGSLGNDSQVGEEAPESALILTATVEGSVYLHKRVAALLPPVLVSRRRQLHTEPISSIAVSVEAGVVATTDIAQRLLITSFLPPGAEVHRARVPALFIEPRHVGRTAAIIFFLLTLVFGLGMLMGPLE